VKQRVVSGLIQPPFATLRPASTTIHPQPTSKDRYVVTQPTGYTPVDFGTEAPQAPKKSKKNLIVTIAAVVVVVALAIVAAMLLTSSGEKTTQEIAQEFNTGLSQANLQQNDAAIATFNQVIKDDPTNKGGYAAIAYFNIGSIKQAQQLNGEAIANYEAALKLAPGFINAMYNMAVALTPTDPVGAMAEYRKILVIKPKDANSLYNLGLLTYNSGNEAQGRVLILRAIAISPSLETKVPANIVLRPKK
jgi:tetratricopeptide (TPR) repeat protein